MTIFNFNNCFLIELYRQTKHNTIGWGHTRHGATCSTSISPLNCTTLIYELNMVILKLFNVNKFLMHI